MSLFHINRCFLSKNIEELEYLINKTKTDFDVIGISKSRIKKNKYPKSSINLKDYSFEFRPTLSSASCASLYSSSHLSNKIRSDMSIYKSREVESIFIEILNPKKSNVIVGCIYHHSNM